METRTHHRRGNSIASLSNILLLKIVSKLLKRDIDNLCVTSKSNFDKICQNKGLWDSMSMLKYGNKFEPSTAETLESFNKIRQWYFLRYTETYVFGANENNCLGLPNQKYINKLSPVQNLTGVRSVSFGSWHTAFVRYDGMVYTSGSNSSGQRGIIRNSALVSYLASNVKEVCCLYHATYVLDNNNVLSFFGETNISTFQYKDGKMVPRNFVDEPADSVEMIVGVTNIQKIKSDYGDVLAIELNEEIYLSQDPNLVWGYIDSDIITSELYLIDKNGEIMGDEPGEQHYWALHKVYFAFPDMTEFSNFKTLEVRTYSREFYIYIVDTNNNLHAASFAQRNRFSNHKLIHTNVRQITSIASTVYFVDELGDLYQYDFEDENEDNEDDDEFSVELGTIIFTSARSISLFDHNLLVLNQEGTLFVPSMPSQKLSQFINNTGKNFGDTTTNTFVPLYTNIDMIASNYNRIIMSAMELKL